MNAYLSFFAIEFATIFIARCFGLKNRMIILTPAVIFATMFSGLRGNVGTDTYSYRFFYNYFFLNEQVAFEPLFSVLAVLGWFAGLPDQFFLFCIAVMQGGFLIYLIKNISSRDLFLLVYLMTYYIAFHFNLIRFGLALLICGFAFIASQKTNNIYPRILYFIGFLTHFSMILFVPFLKFQKRVILISSGFVLIAGFLMYPLLQLKYQNLLVQGCESGWVPTFGLGFILEVAILCSVVAVHRSSLNNARLFGALLGYVVFRLVGCGIPGADRISMFFGYLFYIILFADRLNYLSRLCVVALALFHFYGTLMFLQNSDEAMLALTSGNSEFTVYENTKWLPYRFFWQDDSVDYLK